MKLPIFSCGFFFLSLSTAIPCDSICQKATFFASQCVIEGQKSQYYLILNQTETYTMLNNQRDTEIHDANTEQSLKQRHNGIFQEASAPFFHSFYQIPNYKNEIT